MDRNCLVLVQSRTSSEYNDFIGKFYHFPGNKSKSYTNQFYGLPIEFIYYEPMSNDGLGEYFGYGTITTHPFEDKREQGYYFVEIDSYKPFKRPVPFKNQQNTPREANSLHYNPQNSVRKIPSEVLDEICLDGEIQLNFKADAHLIKVLGEQLIASEKVGILELIKNSYDAHASKCTVRIEKISSLNEIANEFYKYPDLVGPVVIIEDDGSGMDRDIIENGWLRPASTLKTNIKERLKRERAKALKEGSLAQYESLIVELKKANKNRIPLGEKGVGRFATHRLGQSLIIKTKTASINYEYVLSIDWNKFDDYSHGVKDLHSIGVGLTRQPPSRDYGEKNSGTQIIIYGGREGFDWTEGKIYELNRSILQLNSPHPHPSAIKSLFDAVLEVPQLPNLSIGSDIDLPPSFEFTGLVDRSGVMDYSLSFMPPSAVVPMSAWTKDDTINLLDSSKTFWPDRTREPDCGPFFVFLKLWYRKSPWIDGPEAKSFMDRLTQYGGISIYRDGINIFPAEWGAQTDWLDLSKKHIKQGWRLSYYNMIGNIEIEQGSNITLTDKTDRQGLLENQAYNDLRQLVKAIIEGLIENYWTGIRDEYSELTSKVVRDPKMLREYTQQAIDINNKIKNNYPLLDDPNKLLDGLGGNPLEREERLVNLTRSLRDLQKSLKLIEESQEMLTEQAGYGLAIASSIHEISKITTNFFYSINDILKKDDFDKEKLKELRESSSSLQTELKRLAPLRALRGEKCIEFALSRPIFFAIEVYKERMKKKNITIKYDKNEDFTVFSRFGALVQIFTNLLDNSLYWLDSPDFVDRRISINVDAKFRSVIFADTGPGVHSSILPHLFKAGYSLKVPRSGLGLYISKYYMQDMKGDIQLIANPKFRFQDMPGAQFLLDFSRVAQVKEL